MFNNPHFDNVRRIFADQFESDGSGYLYRKGMKGPPIRVSEAERDTFISDFNRHLRLAAWSVVPTTVLLIGLLVIFIPDVDSPIAQTATYIGIGCILVPFLLVYYWAWNRPARELERRPVEGNARSREEVRRLMFAKLTYGRLALAVVFAAAMVWKVSAKNDVLHGWGVLWLIFAAALVVFAGIQAFRKWRYERS